MIRSLTIEEDNLSVAWAKAFLHVVDAGEIATLLSVVIRGFTDGQPMEVAPIRLLLDDTLGYLGEEGTLLSRGRQHHLPHFAVEPTRQIVISSTTAIGESCRGFWGTVGTGTASTSSA